MNIGTHKKRRNSVEEAGGKFKALRISDKFVLILHIFLQPFASRAFNAIYEFLKLCFECTVNGSLQMVVKKIAKSKQICRKFAKL